MKMWLFYCVGGTVDLDSLNNVLLYLPVPRNCLWRIKSIALWFVTWARCMDKSVYVRQRNSQIATKPCMTTTLRLYYLCGLLFF